jgi:hypothetical protein
VEELDHLRQFCFPEMPHFTIADGRTRLLEEFCRYRKRYFELYPDVYAELLDTFENLGDSDASSNEQERRRQIKSPIYWLDDETKASFR